MSHIAHQLYVHITWGTEQRLRLIEDDVKKQLNRIIEEICQERGLQIIAFNTVEDHVHLLVRFKPNSILSEFVKSIKGRSSRLIPCIVNKNLKWQKGYSITTVGPKALKTAITYVKDQQNHHRKTD
jgi:putative transposase